MSDADSSPASQWLDLSEAARYLGVHFTTLRRWADAGKVSYIRTPGGRRRFALADLQRFLAAMHHPGGAPAGASGEAPGLVPLEARTLHAARQQLQSRSMDHRELLSHFAEEQRAMFRYSGQRLLGLLIQFGSRAENGDTFLEEARRLATEYGTTCSQAGMSVTDTVRTFLFFAHSMLEAIQQAGMLSGAYDAESHRLYWRMNEFMDAVLLATIESYLHRPPASINPALEG